MKKDPVLLIHLEFNVSSGVIEMAQQLPTNNLLPFEEAANNFNALYEPDGAFRTTPKERILYIVRSLITNCPGYYHSFFKKLRKTRQRYSRPEYDFAL